MKKLLSLAIGLIVSILVVMILLVWSGSGNGNVNNPLRINETSSTASLTDAERFAEKNDVSIELAESLELALQKVSYGRRNEYSLAQMYNFEKRDDWAFGQRYKVWADMEYVWIIYTKDDTVVSIRDSRMDFIYDTDVE